MDVKKIGWILIGMQILFQNIKKNSTLKLRGCYYHTWRQHFYISWKILGIRNRVRKDEHDMLLIWEKLSSSDQKYEDKEHFTHLLCWPTLSHIWEWANRKKKSKWGWNVNIHPSIKSSKNLAKTARDNYFGTLETNQKRVPIWEVLVQEKWLNIFKNSQICWHFNLC